jgi:hypothetical protein
MISPPVNLVHIIPLPPPTQAPRSLRSHAWRLLVPGKHHRRWVFRKRQHLMPSMIRHGHRCPRAPDSRNLSTRIHPIDTSHGKFTTGIYIIAMITLTSDKFTLVKVGFSIRDPVHQGSERSTPRWMARLGASDRPSRKVVYDSTDLCGVMGWDNACQEALYPCMLATVRRPV